MSIRKYVFAIICILCGLAIGGAIAYLRNRGDTIRNPASVLPAPNLRVLPYAHSLQGKNNRLLNITIATVSGLPENDYQ